MCTVSYLPTADGFVLTSNRDENPKRSTKGLSVEKRDGCQLLHPKDTKGGTWICVSNDNRLVCLLNGAFAKHRHQPPYPKSRGVIVKDFFGFENMGAFHATYDLTGIEPFTMVVWDKGRLYQFRRDESQSYLTELDVTGTYLWSSATLYDQAAKIKRQGWFDKWKKQGDLRPESILRLHQTGGDGDIRNDYRMNRNGLIRTVSITQVLGKTTGMEMAHRDLLRGDTLYEGRIIFG